MPFTFWLQIGMFRNGTAENLKENEVSQNENKI